MNTATRRRIAETTAEDLARLANQAETKGIRILVDHRTGQHVATSASDPTRCYQVDAERGCTCRGYGTWGRCQHHSLLLSELGLIPDAEPVVAEILVATEIVMAERPAPCRSCHGEGVTRAYVGGRLSDWVAVPCGCRVAAVA